MSLESYELNKAGHVAFMDHLQGGYNQCRDTVMK